MKELSLFIGKRPSAANGDDVPIVTVLSRIYSRDLHSLFTSLHHLFTSWIRLIVLLGTTTGLLRDAFMSVLLEETHVLGYLHGEISVEVIGWSVTYGSSPDALTGGDDPCLMDAKNDPCLRQGSGGQLLPPLSVPYGSSPHFSCAQRDGAYLRLRLFGNSPSLLVRLQDGIVKFIRRRRTARTPIQCLPFFSSHPLCRSRNVGARAHHLQEPYHDTGGL
ncbi:hypothetical protein ACLOJK_034804 [Asimina triloba]